MSLSSVCSLLHDLLGLLANMTLGQTGLGKSTMINTLFASHLIDSKGRFESDEEVRQTTEIHPVSHGKPPISLRRQGVDATDSHCGEWCEVKAQYC